MTDEDSNKRAKIEIQLGDALNESEGMEVSANAPLTIFALLDDIFGLIFDKLSHPRLLVKLSRVCRQFCALIKTWAQLPANELQRFYFVGKFDGPNGWSGPDNRQLCVIRLYRSHKGNGYFFYQERIFGKIGTHWSPSFEHLCLKIKGQHDWVKTPTGFEFKKFEKRDLFGCYTREELVLLVCKHAVAVLTELFGQPKLRDEYSDLWELYSVQNWLDNPHCLPWKFIEFKQVPDIHNRFDTSPPRCHCKLVICYHGQIKSRYHLNVSARNWTDLASALTDRKKGGMVFYRCNKYFIHETGVQVKRQSMRQNWLAEQISFKGIVE